MALTAQDIANVEQTSQAIRGSAGNVTWSRNRYGLYRRARVTPANPSTPEQVFTRFQFRLISQRWSATLTESQRAGWRAYATRRRLGGRYRNRPLSGYGEYMRSAYTRRRNAIPTIDDAPDLAGGLEVTKMSVTITAPSINMVISFNTNDPWRFELNTWIIINATDPYPSSINSFKPPYQARGKRRSTIISPFTVSLGIACARGQRVFYSIVVVDGTGRVGPFDRDRVIVQ